jgi:hypothetical protein
MNMECSATELTEFTVKMVALWTGVMQMLLRKDSITLTWYKHA